MALTHQRILEIAEAGAKVADQLKKTYRDLVVFLETNSDLAIDWLASSKPSYINEDSDGNLDGKKFTRQQVGNLIGSVDQVRKLLENKVMSSDGTTGGVPHQGDHLGNLNQVASVEVD